MYVGCAFCKEIDQNGPNMSVAAAQRRHCLHLPSLSIIPTERRAQHYTTMSTHCIGLPHVLYNQFVLVLCHITSNIKQWASQGQILNFRHWLFWWDFPNHEIKWLQTNRGCGALIMAWESSPVGRIGMVGTRRASSGANSAIIRDHRSSPRELRAHFNTFESFSSARALVLQSSSITKVQYPGKSQNRGMTYAKVYPETVAGTNIVERKHYPWLFTTRSQITIQRLSGDLVKRLQMIIRSLTTTT